MLDQERVSGGNRAILVHMDINDEAHRENLSEFKELVLSSGADILDIVTTSRQRADPKYFIGSGKALEIANLVKQHEVDLVLFNHKLAASQERNLEGLIECRVLDRTGLILDIFAQRARSFEGKLQVELAQLRHLSTRLVRGWTHLERQKGGIGLRGPGETQLETDRRLLGLRIKQINKRLAKVKKQREQGRQSRQKAEIATVSLVGYTNAGKSSLFNVLCDDDVYVQDQLFATLDPTLRRVDLSQDVTVILADTVGFIRHLPHDLVTAFRSTLQETSEAQLLLHIIDSADPNRDANINEVNKVLTQINANKIHCIHIMNKIDLTGTKPRIDFADDGKVKRIWISVEAGEGIDLLKQTLIDLFREKMIEGQLTLTPADARIRARLFEIGAIRNEIIDEEGHFRLKISISRRDLNQFESREQIPLESMLLL
ncbi:Ribosome LSU-associated GTP-binding protein HflX [hydrothermal vent metagenome]|uniref:Ribosome LSU-associated GTP-binding protein HflX n=1 Tax=hydrothermal vent metagenome TaxID=652676 RepID=A0A3B0W3C6_9ZZZZ